jgi:hypothetical protein
VRTTFAYGIVLILAAWFPGGLIHLGQRTVSPRAESILGQLANRCDPTTAEWRGCK